jgi:hypothetical protein
MEGNAKMKSAVEKGDLIKVATAQLILDTATTKREEYNQKLEGHKKNMILISSAKSNNFGDEDTYVNHDYILLYSNF